MNTSLKTAADYSEQLAVAPFKGEIYDKFRDEIGFIEGACRQASAWRDDARWLDLAAPMAEVHKRAGDWLRGYKVYGERVKLAEKELNLNFIALAAVLRRMMKAVDTLKNARPPKLGMITPDPVMPFLREDRKHRVILPPSVGSLIIPHGAY